jgi:tRNA pseudouridine38-40 synthase
MISIFAETNIQSVPRYFLELSYKGTRFHGWQIQKNAPSVQEVLNQTLEVLLKEKVETTGAGRTDTGVHAKYFVAHFDSAKEKLHENHRFLSQLNQILPEDIAILKIVWVPDTAHARFDALSRTYEYHIATRKNPFMNEYAWYLKKTPDQDLMNKAAKKLLTITDFTSFSKLHSNTKTNLCKVSKAIWEEKDGMLVFTITADRFLRNMVRAIVGTLVNVGLGKTSMEEYMDIIESRNRSNAGQSVPGKGLFLTDISYPFSL